MQRGLCMVLSVAVGTAACGRLFKGHGIGQSVVVATVESRQASPQITAPATLAASDRAEISFPREVRIEKIFVTEGDVVNKGDPIVSLDLSTRQSALAQLRATRREAAAEFDRNRYLLENRDKLRDEKKMDDLQYAGVEKEVELSAARAERTDAEIAALEQELAAGTVSSPIGGMVVRRGASVGQNLAAGVPALEIVAPDPLLAQFHLTADEAGSIAPGDSVRIRIEELPGETFEATVRFVGPSLEMPGSTFAVWAALPNPLAALKIGMRAFADFRTTKVHDIFLVPASALTLKNGRPHVYIIQSGVARLQPVVVKGIDDEEATLASGVHSGDLVVVKGAEGLQDGAVVDVR
ncbi:MAG: efflux RND transporter periplasmic adaptor subunit [Deltaproteobacteria bacterium]|nr:efflux RND transporter periplasmic adaptor subunit [Deltaproteobacteria bacterium]